MSIVNSETKCLSESTSSQSPTFTLDEAVEKYQNLVWKLAQSFKRKNKNEDLDDLVQVGYLGLIRAYNKYNPNFKTKFITFLYICCYQDLLRYVKKNQIRLQETKISEASVIEEAIPDYLSEMEFSIVNLLKDGHKPDEIINILSINKETYSKHKNLAFNKIRSANEEKSSTRK